MNQPVIKLTDIKKSFGKQHVLNGINLTVEPGELVGLIGPSGAGKSTVIKTMLGMEKADSGEALILGKQMPNRKILGKLGYMAQSDALYETLSAKENLKFFGEMKSGGNHLEQDMENSVRVVNLKNHLNKKVRNYSGGMKRRLSLAIALLNQPQLYVLDEPTVGIDPALRQKIWRDLKNLKNQGASILVTTHVMDEAELVDKVAILLDGKIVAFDNPKTLESKYHVDNVEQVFLKIEEENNYEE